MQAYYINQLQAEVKMTTISASSIYLIALQCLFLTCRACTVIILFTAGVIQSKPSTTQQLYHRIKPGAIGGHIPKENMIAENLL